MRSIVTSNTRDDRATLQLLLPKLLEIIEHHICAARVSASAWIPNDGLLRPGRGRATQLTWMDAKVEDWVVTPRRGKPVEINALWYNALRMLENWLRAEQGEISSAADAEHAGAGPRVV